MRTNPSRTHERNEQNSHSPANPAPENWLKEPWRLLPINLRPAYCAAPVVCPRLQVARLANASAQRILPVNCMTTKSVTIAPMVIASPVNPWKKKA